MTQFRQILESGPYRSFQSGKFRFHETNINDLLSEQIISYLDGVDIAHAIMVEKLEEGISYKVHKINNTGYYLIECDDTVIEQSLGDGTNYVKSYPAIGHGTIYGNNKIYFIISHPEVSSKSLINDVIEQMRGYIKEIKLPE